MVSYEFKFKRRGAEGFIKITINDDGSMELPEAEFTNPSNTCQSMLRIIQSMLSENWVQVQIREL